MTWSREIHPDAVALGDVGLVAAVFGTDGVTGALAGVLVAQPMRTRARTDAQMLRTIPPNTGPLDAKRATATW